MRWSRGALIAGCLLVVACSGGGDAEPPESSAPPTTPPTTEPVPSSTVTTTTTSTTEPPSPPTTEDPTLALIADIEADLNAGEQAMLRAGADPGSPESRAVLEHYYSGPALSSGVGFFDSLAAEGLRMRANADRSNTIEVLDLVSVSGDPVSFALVELCRIDAAVIYEPRGDGDEVIVNDAITVSRAESRVNFVEGVWRLDGGTSGAVEPGDSRCAV